MENPVPNRRKLSQGGLLDSAIQTLSPLTSSPDLNTRSLASRVVGLLLQLRRQMPRRRQQDGGKTLKK